MIARLSSRDVRVYQHVRSAHLERARDGAQTSTLYHRRSYDFDTSVADAVEAVQLSTAKLALVLLRNRVDVLEINEPLLRSGLAYAVVAVIATRLRGLVTRRRTAIVTYAIGNADPFTRRPEAGVKARLRFRVDCVEARWIVRRLDRIAFGTGAAHQTYVRTFGRALGRTVRAQIDALSVACECNPSERRDENTVLFLGSFEERKGFDLILDAWPALASAAPHSRLVLVGKGPLESRAKELARKDERVELVVDPPRSVIHRHLRGAGVLVLMSRRMPHWREQVGLPIVEGLAHGARIVSTDETGIADWLHAHGHCVLDADTAPQQLAEALAGVLQAPNDPASVLADLPVSDGRLAADRWMRETG